jgi:hypothetical protein
MADKDVRERLSSDTLKQLNKKGFQVRSIIGSDKKYRKGAYMYEGCDMLEYQYPVRVYVQEKYDLTLRELELLLFLFPKKFFTHETYKSYPLSFTHKNINTLIKKDFVYIFSKGKRKTENVYSLTKSAQLKVRNYYKLLSGELEIPTIAENNPLIRKDANNHKKKINNLFKMMKQRDLKDPEQ